ncbi:Ankyrin repeat domain-containing protein 13A, partial [Nowakowskiella sp. JEL0078]
PKIVIADHERKTVQQIYPWDFSLSDDDVEEDLNIALNSAIIGQPEVDFDSINFSRSKVGFWKSDRSEGVGKYSADVWTIDCCNIKTKSRTEHLEVDPKPASINNFTEMTNEEIRWSEISNSLYTFSGQIFELGSKISKSKDPRDQIIENSSDSKFSTSWLSLRGSLNLCKMFRPTILPPEPSMILSQSEYQDSAKRNLYCHFGRPVVLNYHTRKLKATIWMHNSNSKEFDISSNAPQIVPPIQSNDFPVSINDLLPILDLLGMSSNEHICSLKKFFHFQLPPGFPIQISLPVPFSPLSALITFDNISKYHERFNDITLFQIPGENEGFRTGE